MSKLCFFFFFQAEDGIRDDLVTGVQTCALPILPGLSNLWVQPIRNRIDMLSTGIKSPVGIKIAGPDLKVIERIGEQVEATVKAVQGTRSAYAERVQIGRASCRERG